MIGERWIYLCVHYQGKGIDSLRHQVSEGVFYHEHLKKEIQNIREGKQHKNTYVHLELLFNVEVLVVLQFGLHPRDGMIGCIISIPRKKKKKKI